MLNNMKIVYSDLCLLGGDCIENVSTLVDHGADCVELMMDGGWWDGYQTRKVKLASELGSLPVSYTLHSPCWDINLSSENQYIREASLKSALDAVEFAQMLGCSHLVVHPGFCQATCFDKAKGKELTLQALDVICRRARESGVLLAVENVGYNGSSLYTQQEFVHLLDEIGKEAMYLIDTGHAILNKWDVPAVIKQLSGRLCGLHLHDNNGVSDTHQPVQEGVIDWSAVLDETAKLSSGCSLVLEYNIGIPPERLGQAKVWLENELKVRM